MQLVIETVIPVFVIIAAGWWARRAGLLEEKASSALNQYVFYFAVPAMMFLATSKFSLSEVINGPFLLAYFLASVLTVTIGFIPYRALGIKGPLDSMVVALNNVWANTIYMGVPLFFFIFGEKGTLPVVMATLTTNMVFIFCMALFANMEDEATDGDGKHIGTGQKKASLPELFIKIFLKNPVMLAPILGMLVSYLQLPVPKPLDNLLSMVAPSAAPVALFSLGLALYGLKIQGNLFQLSWITGVKLLVHPLMAFIIVTVMDLEPFWAASTVLLSALPTGAMVYVLAQQYEKRVDLSSSVIFSTTVLSILTLAVLLPLMKDWAG